jgi:uncharacterized protein (TIGR03545 family)
MRGQDIRFPAERSYPKFWIMKALISGGTDSAGTGSEIHAKGEVRNISDDQSVTRVPLTAALEGIEGGGRAFSLKATLDRTKEIPFDDYTATLDGIPLTEFRLGNKGFLAGTMTGARMTSSVRVTVPGRDFDTRTNLRLSRFTLSFAGEPANFLERIVREVLQGIDALEVGLRLWSTPSGVDIALSTDLDNRIAGRVQNVVGAEIAKLQKDLKAKLDAAIALKRQEVERFVALKRAEIEKQLTAYQSLVDEKLALVENKKKELTDRLEKEKQGKVEGLLKGILKK